MSHSHTGGSRRRLEKWTNYNSSMGRTDWRIKRIVSHRCRGEYIFIWGLWKTKVIKFSKSNRFSFQKLLCAYAFPKCTIKDGRPKMLPLCYEDCVATHQQFCYNDWVLLEEKRDRGMPLKTRGHFRLPDCKSLPRYNSSGETPTCSWVGLTEINQEDITCKFVFYLFFFHLSSNESDDETIHF